jgi:hypothetical protein
MASSAKSTIRQIQDKPDISLFVGPLVIEYHQPMPDDPEIEALIRVYLAALANRWQHLADLTRVQLEKTIRDEYDVNR